MEQLPESHDDALKSMLSLTLILFVYLYPVVRYMIPHWYRSTFASILAKYNRNMFVRHGILHRVKCIPMPNMYARAFATANDHAKDYLSWDTDGTPFVIDNSMTVIISSQRRLLTVPLIHT